MLLLGFVYTQNRLRTYGENVIDNEKEKSENLHNIAREFSRVIVLVYL